MPTWRSPFDESMGTRTVLAEADRVVAELSVTPQHHQPGGTVHGGVFATLAELTASVGANVWLDGSGVAVGVSNHTDFLRAVVDGQLSAEATPLQRGRRLQLWEVRITDGQGALVAHGKVKLANLEATPGREG